jgi:transposase-like protein
MDWEYSEVVERETIPPCPKCPDARGVVKTGLVDRGGRYSCNGCGVKFVARRLAPTRPPGGLGAQDG